MGREEGRAERAGVPGTDETPDGGQEEQNKKLFDRMTEWRGWKDPARIAFILF
jgi:hypothetical protein